jgi:hypothetical protein
MGERRYSSTILDFGTRWRLSGQLHISAVLTQRNELPLDGPPIRSGCCGIQKNLLPWPGTESRVVEPVAHRYTELSRILALTGQIHMTLTRDVQ